ncbi:MAG: class I SAM-dependent methyltransferase [Pseudomonadota bacterium]
MADGWFDIPGVQRGPRTLAEQLKGLAPALAEAPGKTVLDLGCAEGLIAVEFARAGAMDVTGVEYNPDIVATAVAEMHKAGPLPMMIHHADIAELIASPARPQWDIVLALAVLHKLQDPAAGVKYCAASARSLIVIRLPYGSTGQIRSKYLRHMRADVAALLKAEGFANERVEPGPRGEWVQYWRRK